MNRINTPPYSGFPVVSDERVTLRQVLAADMAVLKEISFYDSVQAQSLDQAIEMNLKIDADYEKGDSIHWGIIDNQSGKIAGTCGYYRGFANDEGELGCVLLPQYRGQGLMTSAMLLAINFGFTGIGLKRIKAITARHNTKAINLIERLGFKRIRYPNPSEVEFELLAEQQ